MYPWSDKNVTLPPTWTFPETDKRDVEDCNVLEEMKWPQKF